MLIKGTSPNRAGHREVAESLLLYSVKGCRWNCFSFLRIIFEVHSITFLPVLICQILVFTLCQNQSTSDPSSHNFNLPDIQEIIYLLCRVGFFYCSWELAWLGWDWTGRAQEEVGMNCYRKWMHRNQTLNCYSCWEIVFKAPNLCSYHQHLGQQSS